MHTIPTRLCSLQSVLPLLTLSQLLLTPLNSLFKSNNDCTPSVVWSASATTYKGDNGFRTPHEHDSRPNQVSTYRMPSVFYTFHNALDS